MHVAAIVPSYPPRSRVGAWLATHECLAELVRRGHRVNVCTHTDVDPVVLDGVHVRCGTPEPADIVISHLGDPTALAAELARQWGRPNVRMAHGNIPDPDVLEGAALVVFNSHALATSVDCPGASIVVHPPVDPARYRTTPGDHVTLVNLAEPKGGELFWRLVRCSQRRFLAVKGGYGSQYLETFPHATVIEPTANMRDDVYAQTRILLMPSDRETWGMVGIEAMASGIPVIAHPTDGLVESLDAAGIFVDRENAQGWLDEIERLHDPDEWTAASAAALARSAALDHRADLDRFATAIEALHCTRRPA